MLVYNYDKNTKEYTGTSTPQINPKKDGEYLIPANSTTIAPTEKQEGYAHIFDGEKWNCIDDLRDKVAINTETKERFVVKTLGKLEVGCMLYSDYQNTDSYKSEQLLVEKENKKKTILSRLDEIDIKRIRAFCEPESKTDSGKSWLEYYNAQIVELREQLKEL